MNQSHEPEPAGSSEGASKTRGLLVFAAKATVTLSLIVWLIRSDSLEMDRLRIFLESPKVLIVSLLTWMLVSVGMTSWRWRILLRAVGARVSLLQGVALQVTALFFNGLVPGNVGGDFIKNQAVLGNQAAKLFVLVLVERSVGLISLVWAGGVGVLLSFRAVAEHSELTPIAGAVFVLVCGSIVFPLIAYSLLRPSEPSQTREISGQGLVGRLRRALYKMMGAFQLIVEAKGCVTKGLLVSFLMHLGNMTFFWFLARQLGNPEAQLSEIAMVFPLGVITLVLPISISGLGVGHVMFNELFSLLGMNGGATVFNVYIVAQLAPCVLGAVPYLFMRGQAESRNQGKMDA